MRHLAVGGVRQRQLDGVANADAQHRAGNRAAEGPELVGDALVQVADDFADLDLLFDRLRLPGCQLAARPLAAAGAERRTACRSSARWTSSGRRRMRHLYQPRVRQPAHRPLSH